MTTSLLKPNSCGECNVCCVLPKVSDLNKPANQPCQHLRPGKNGCTVYAQRPACCQTYACLWVQGFMGEDTGFRPDNLGVLFELHSTPHGPLYVYREVKKGLLIEEGNLHNSDHYPSDPFLIIDVEGTGYLITPSNTTPEKEARAVAAIKYLEGIA